MDNTDLNRLEREAFRKFYDDGTLDIYLGLLLGLMPLAGWLADRLTSNTVALAMTAAVYVPLVVGFVLVRKYIVAPRLGRFKPARPRRRKIAAARFALAASVVLGLLLWAVFARGTQSADLLTWMPVIWLANCLVVFGAMAFFLDVPRFYAYGFLFGVPLMVDSWVEGTAAMAPGPWVVFGVPGSIAACVGIVLFVRFLRHYPAREVGVGANGPVA